MNNRDAFPIGKEREDLVRGKEKTTHEFEVTGAKQMQKGKYKWRDSALEGSGDSPQLSYGETFKNLLPWEGLSFRGYIEIIIKKMKGKALGVDFGGIGSRLFAGFSPKFFTKSIGVTLVDHRKPKDLHFAQQEDAKINHEVLVGNIFDEETYKSLYESLNGEKIDFIISRMAGGLEFVPTEPYTVGKILEIWYELLAEEGVMFVQVPIAFNNLLKVWAERIQKDFKKVIDMQYSLGVIDSKPTGRFSAFSLHKLPGAPDKLPLLDPRTVRKTSIYKKT